MRIYDISVPISQSMAVWEGQPPAAVTYHRHVTRGDRATVGHLAMTLHTGTHVDAPRHQLVDGLGVDALDLDTLVGPAYVAHALAATALTPSVLDGLGIPASAQRLLIRTRNSALWSRSPAAFTRDYVGLTGDGARWVVERRIRLVGTDYMSVAAWDDLIRAHHTLLGAGVILLEGIDLTDVSPGMYELVCLPLKITDGDGAPARVILIDRGCDAQ